jgi:hypothetical protein
MHGTSENIYLFNRHIVMVSSQRKNKVTKVSARINLVYSYISTSLRRSEESITCAGASADWRKARTSDGRGRRVGSNFERKKMLLTCRQAARWEVGEMRVVEKLCMIYRESLTRIIRERGELQEVAMRRMEISWPTS